MQPENNWKYKSLVNLQKMSSFVPMKDPPTRLVRRCEELLLVPLDQYAIEDLRLMIGQKFGLQYLIPLAIEKLQEDIFVEGDFYPGDLLSGVLNVDALFWKENLELYKTVSNLIDSRKEELTDADISFVAFENSL